MISDTVIIKNRFAFALADNTDKGCVFGRKGVLIGYACRCFDVVLRAEFD